MLPSFLIVAVSALTAAGVDPVNSSATVPAPPALACGMDQPWPSPEILILEDQDGNPVWIPMPQRRCWCGTGWG